MGSPELLCSRTRLCRKTGERLHFITPTVEHPPAVLMWGAFAPNGIRQIRFLEKNETCNSTWYLKVLKQQVKWSAHSLFGGTFYLQDDGAPCHRSDLNPTENLWGLLKKVWSHNFNNTTERKPGSYQSGTMDWRWNCWRSWFSRWLIACMPLAKVVVDQHDIDCFAF